MPRRALTPLRLAVAGVVLLAVTLIILITRGSSDFLEIPDEAHPLAELVDVQGGKQQRDGGGIYYVDVLIKHASLLESLVPALRPDGADLVQRNQITSPGISDKDRIKLELADMKLSQETASAVALRALGYPVRPRPGGLRVVSVTAESQAAGKIRPGDVIVSAQGTRVRDREGLRRVLARTRIGEVVRVGVRRGRQVREVAVRTTSDRFDPRRPIIGVIPVQALDLDYPFKISFDLGEVGGPSAGLAFALEVMEKRGRDIDQGYKVAATGEIQLDGRVTRIGGVKQKTIGARQADVDVFLVPADGDNATEAKRYARGLKIIPVESFQQALRALATLPPKA